MGTRIGLRAPGFELPATDGNTHSLGMYADRAARVVIFSCNHCPYVEGYEDRMIAIARDYADRGVAVVAINANDADTYPEDSFENMKARAARKAFPFPYLRDETQAVATEWGATHTPEVFVVDARGLVVYHGAIDDSPGDERAVRAHHLRQALDDLLAGRPIAVAETTPAGCTIKWRSGGCVQACDVKDQPG